MKTSRILAGCFLAMWGTSLVSAQTADEIITKYLTAIGGKDQISQINTLYAEGVLNVSGSQGSIKISRINGKAYKQEIDVMGTQVTLCFTDSAGWQINPMTGNYSAVEMAEVQYKGGRDDINLTGPFVDYAAKGFKAELVGQQTVGNVNAHKVIITSSDNVTTEYYFDPETGYLVQMIQNSEMGGQSMMIITAMSDYKKNDSGFAMPYTTETNYGGQFFLTTNITKVDINQPLDAALFVKP